MFDDEVKVIKYFTLGDSHVFCSFFFVQIFSWFWYDFAMERKMCCCVFHARCGSILFRLQMNSYVRDFRVFPLLFCMCVCLYVCGAATVLRLSSHKCKSERRKQKFKTKKLHAHTKHSKIHTLQWQRNTMLWFGIVCTTCS